MNLDCDACGAELRVNRNLAGTTLSCPQCGADVEVPSTPLPPRARTRRPRPAPAQKKPKPAPAPMSLALFGAQTLLLLLALTCFAGVFMRNSWKPPVWSFLHEDVVLLAIVGIGLVFATLLARRFPITATLLVVLTVLLMCALHFRAERAVDASRILVLSISMVALWLAMEHRGVT